MVDVRSIHPLKQIGQCLMPRDSDEALHKEIKRLNDAVFGQDGKLGIAQQNMIMWRFHVYLLCLCSGAVGVTITILVHKFLKP